MRKPTEAEIQKNPDINEMLKDYETISTIDAVANSKGGKVLVKSLIDDVMGDVDTLCAKHSKLTMQEFVSICADMKSKIDLVRVLKRSKKNKKFLEELIDKVGEEE